jgi:hypothetical protein
MSGADVTVAYIKAVAHNLWYPHDRLAVCLIVMVVLTALTVGKVDANSKIPLERLLGWIAGIGMIPMAVGMFAITWWLYSHFKPLPAVLLGSRAPIHTIHDYGKASGLYLFVVAAGILFVVAIFRRVRSWLRFPAMPAAFIGTTVIVNVAVIAVNLGWLAFK